MDRIELTLSDGEILGCYVGDHVTHNLRGISGTIVGLGDTANTVKIKLDDTGETAEVTAENFQDYWE